MKNEDLHFIGVLSHVQIEIICHIESILENIDSSEVIPFKSMECETKLKLIQLLKYKTIMYNLKVINEKHKINIYEYKISEIEELCINLEGNLDLDFDLILPLKNSFLDDSRDMFINVLGDYLLGIKNNYQSKDNVKRKIVNEKCDINCVLDCIKPFYIEENN